MLKYIFLINAGGVACLWAWSDFPSFLSLADHMPDKIKNLMKINLSYKK